MKENKRIGKIYDGRWEVISYEKYASSNAGIYTLRNIYNGNVTTVKDTSLRLVEKGLRTISSIMAVKIKRHII